MCSYEGVCKAAFLLDTATIIAIATTSVTNIIQYLIALYFSRTPGYVSHVLTLLMIMGFLGATLSVFALNDFYMKKTTTLGLFTRIQLLNSIVAVAYLITEADLIFDTKPWADVTNTAFFNLSLWWCLVAILVFPAYLTMIVHSFKVRTETPQPVCVVPMRNGIPIEASPPSPRNQIENEHGILPPSYQEIKNGDFSQPPPPYNAVINKMSELSPSIA